MDKYQRERLGETRLNNAGLEMKIIKYNSATDIDIQFIKSGYISYNNKYYNFVRGTVKDHRHPSHFGLGYTDGEDTGRVINGKWVDDYEYDIWSGLFVRCYSEKKLKRCRTYREVEVAEEWHNYKNFKRWHKENYYEIEGEKMCLDKDILAKGNKIYSPDTCIYVPEKINLLFKKVSIKRDLPSGVFLHGKTGKYKSIHRSQMLGIYDSIEEASRAYKEAKEQYIKQVADEYKDKIPKKLYDAMYNWKER